MKKLALIFSLLAVCGFTLGACGDDDGGGVCDEATDVLFAAWDEACTGQDDACCSCKCWNDNHQGYDYDGTVDPKTCDCIAFEQGTCDEAQAQACVDDKDACKATFKALMDDATTGMCTLSPMQ